MAKVEKNDVIENEEVEQGERTVRIVIPYEVGEGDVFVSVNARTWLIKRGVEVEVPEYVAAVIRESERNKMAAYEAAAVHAAD